MKRLIKTLEELDIENAGAKAQTLDQYMELILERNQQVNLTAITEREAFIEKHYLDSLAAGRLPEFRAAKTVLDLGTGGGFPGVPLAVAFPEKTFTLVDSLNKRIRIIQEFCERLGIDNVTAIHGRAEDLGRHKELRECFDCCISRAVADMRVLAEYCLPFVRKGGCFIAYKGDGCEEEIAGAKRAVQLLGGEVEQIQALGAPAHQTAEEIVQDRHINEIAGHRLVVIRKVKETPKTYPRRAGTPAKKPL